MLFYVFARFTHMNSVTHVIYYVFTRNGGFRCVQIRTGRRYPRCRTASVLTFIRAYARACSPGVIGDNNFALRVMRHRKTRD